jgi:O-antigen ligase
MAYAAARPSAGRSAGLAFGLAGFALFAVLCGVGIAFGELEATVAAASVIAAVAVLLDYRIGAVLMIIMMPVENTVYFPHAVFGLNGVNPLNLVILATFGSYLLRGRNLRSFLPKPLLWLFIVPIVVAGLIGSRHVADIYPFFYENQVIHYTDAAGYLRDAMLKPLLTVVAALLIGAAVAQSKKAERFLTPIIIAVWTMSLIAILYVLFSGVSLGVLASSRERTFFSALGMHANDLGRLYAVAYALLLFTWGESKDAALKSVLVVTMGVLTLALMLTFSRGAFLGFILVNALFFLWKFNARTVGLGLLVAGVGAVLLPGAVLSRLSLGFGGGGADVNAVSAGRVDEIWMPLMPEVLKSPPWGNGLESTMWSHAIWSQQILEVTHPHNAYLQAILDMGVVGLLLLLAYYLHVYRRLRELGSNAYLSPTLRGFYQGAVAGLACFLVTGFAGSSLRPTPEFSFLWIAIGMMYGQLLRRPEGPAER